MIIIAAMAENRVIGVGDGLPWDVPEEYEQYRRFIADQTVVMGRRSYEIFGADLTSRHTVVVSRSAEEIDGAIVCRSLEDAVAKAESLGRTVFINGGASIYQQALPLVDEMYLSIIKGQYSGDAYFPAFDDADWDVVERRVHDEFEFRRYRRL
jgi:dihydrofolate reductase